MAVLTNWSARSIFTRWMRQTSQNDQGKTGDTHLIGGEFSRQLLLLLPGGRMINATREQGNAIAKLGMRPSATLPSGNRGSRTLKSLTLFTQLGQDLQRSASNIRGSKDMHTETLAPKFLAADALLIARPNNTNKQGLGVQELDTECVVLATRNGRRKLWPGEGLAMNKRGRRRWRWRR